MKRPTRRAFTLVELLVVIGIIAVLVDILLPTLSKARKQALTVKCVSNMRQLMVATVLYANDHKGHLPFSGFYEPPTPNWLYDNGKPMTGKVADLQGGQLWRYLGVANAYRCPQDSGPWAAGAVQNITSYCINGATSAYGTNGNLGLKLDAFHPDDVVYWEFCFSGGNDVNGANDATNYPTEGIIARHKRGTTLAHLDGHADVLPAADFVQLTQSGPNMLWCDPTRGDGGHSLYPRTPSQVHVQYEN